MTDWDKLCGLYRDWNSRINVISRKDIDSVYEHHIQHSLAIQEYLRRFHPSDGFLPGQKILDVGTGGGFPGVPLACEYPSCHFTLCDSIGKKIKVASAVSEGMGLENVECVNARVETLSGPFDWVVTRAVASLDVLWPWIGDKFSRGLICLKGGDVASEIENLRRKARIDRTRIRVWSIAEWLSDDYFAEKFVIEIGKDYLCRPICDN